MRTRWKVLIGLAAALVLIATVPLLVVGAIVNALRDRPGRFHGVAHDVISWLLLYGAAVISGGAHSVRPVWVMGVCFMLAGALIYLLPDAALAMPGTVRPYDVVLAVAFGGIHISFGAVIAIRHGG